MIRNIILPSTCFLLGIVASVSAQYQQHHQQVFVDPSRNPETMIKAEALEPIDDFDEKSWLWTGNWNPPAYLLEDAPIRPLLVKMGRSLPLVAPFSLQWATTYLFPQELEGETSDYIIDVRDVHHIPKNTQYLLCGQLRKKYNRTPEGAFLLKTDWNGEPLMFHFYPNIEILHSVVSKIKPDAGHIAVGSTLPTTEEPRAAVYLSVDSNLSPVCVKQVHGDFSQKGPLDSYYKKVIPYDKTNFAVVGATSHYPEDSNLSSQNVLVSTFDEKCNVICNDHFGGRTFKKTLNNGKVKYTQFFEHGESLVEVGSGQGLVVTGNTRKIQTRNQSRLIFNNILLFRTKQDCSLKFMKHYDVDEKRDVGLAVQIRSFEGSKTIVVAGQSSTHYLASTNARASDDVVLLVAKLTNGALLNLELFGDSGNEGELQGNLDLHLSHNTTEQFPIILGNTEKSWSNTGVHTPYLIERYDEVDEWCHHYVLENKVMKYKFRKYPALDKVMQTEVGKMKLIGVQVELVQQTLCEKKGQV